MSGPTRLVVFDMDGTLIDSQHLIVAAMSRAFAAIGRPAPDRERVLSVVGLSLPEAMTALAPQLAPEDIFALAAHYREGFVAQRASGGSAAHAPLYPGAREALDRLAGEPETLMGVATGKARPGLEHSFAAHGIGGYFATTQTSDGHPSKPHPSMLLRALQETGCEARHAVMIGDTEFDIVMGRAAGFATVAVAWGYHPRARLEAAGADVVIDRFDDLDGALEGLRSAAR
jgi:phosphoglycolate phosphatase